jgi:hypothetical protein
VGAGVALTEAVVAPRDTKHGVTDSIMKNEPVTVDVEAQAKLLTNDDQLSPDQLGDWCRPSWPMVRTSERRLVVCHGDDKLARNSGPPRQNLETR